MKLFLTINWVLVILLSLATGIFKLMQQEADVQLFEAIGFTPWMTTALGAVQALGGIGMVFTPSRKVSAYVMIVTFVIASAAVFANGMVVFGAVSLLFIAMAYGVVYRENQSS